MEGSSQEGKRHSCQREQLNVWGSRNSVWVLAWAYGLWRESSVVVLSVERTLVFRPGVNWARVTGVWVFVFGGSQQIH